MENQKTMENQENLKNLENLNKLKLLLGVENDDKDALLSFVLDKTSDMICNYCRIKEVPKGLQNVMLNMAVELYRSENLGQEQSEGVLKSISEGDVSVSFGSACSINDNPGMAFLKNYTSQLNRYRKFGW